MPTFQDRVCENLRSSGLYCSRVVFVNMSFSQGFAQRCDSRDETLTTP